MVPTSDGQASMSPAPRDSAGPARPLGYSVYKRAYKACESCRKGKSRCEVDSELSDASCVRCRRERRQCVFPAQRSTKRAKTAKLASDQTSSGNGSRDRRSSNTSSLRVGENLRSGRHQNVSAGDLAYEHRSALWTDFESDLQERQTETLPDREIQGSVRDDLSESLAKTIVTSSKDAMGLLFQAADQHGNESRSDNEDSVMPMEGFPAHINGTSDTTSPLMYSQARLPSQFSEENLALWNKHRFVVQGWFSAYEAISYLQFFLDQFAPLSPVADLFYADPGMHKRLILDEPLLCCTILMISSRSLPAHGRAGKTRSSFIHARLWRHIEHLVLRITFGTEKYSSAKTRTLGSIQALLLITEWHPRLLHFPPEHDGWDAGLAPTIDDSFQPQDRGTEKSHRWREEVFEPAKRSDRLSWTLVGLAITLAHELGVFDAHHEGAESGPVAMSDRATKTRIKRLLFFYSQQLALRLGCPNMFPQGDQSLTHLAMTTGRPNPDQPARDRELVLTKWIEITKILAAATQMFFSSKTTTKNILRSHQYLSLLEHFQPLLGRWHDEFSGSTLPTVPAAAKHCLLVDYYYCRMYINSIALQGLVERASQASAGDAWLEQDFLRKESAQDLGFINDVRESSGQILVITKKLSDDGILPHMPVRFFLRVVAASIFLLKIVCLGSKGEDAKVALDQLDDAVQALMSNNPDDIHLSNRYAELISRHVRQLKRKLYAERVTRTTGTGRASVTNKTGLLSQLSACQSDAEINTETDMFINEANPMRTADGPATDHGGDAGGADLWNDALWEDWFGCPLDPLVAPFGIEPDATAAGLASDSLDFLWNSSI